MRELLERWAKLEPERCKLDDRIAWMSIDGAMRPTYTDKPPAFMLALLLSAVIEAIEARGWDWTIEHCSTCSHKYMAWTSVTLPGKYCVTDGSPAEALLSAYLDAVEAQP